jgi:F0F1-type ATP synthase assembly protein I
MTSHPPEKNPEPSPSGSDQQKEKIRLNLRQLRAAAVGWNFITAPLAGGAVGYGIDWLMGVYPWAMGIGIFLGFVSAFIELMRSAR